MLNKFEYLPEDLHAILEFMNSKMFIGALPDLKWYYMLKDEYMDVLNYIMDN